MRRPKIDENLAERCTDPDSRVPVVNNDGQILTGDDAPLLRELDIWLEEHPTFTPLSEVLLVNCHLSLSRRESQVYICFSTGAVFVTNALLFLLCSISLLSRCCMTVVITTGFL